MCKIRKGVCILLCLSSMLLLLSGCDNDSDKTETMDTIPVTSSDEAIETVDSASLNVPRYDDYFELGEYKNLTYYVDDDDYIVTDNLVITTVATDLGLDPKELPLGTVEIGDTVTVSFKGTIDNKPFAGDEATDIKLVVGSNTLAEEFENALVGMQPNKEKVIEYTFPKTYNDTTIAGKKAFFKTTVSKIERYSIDDIDDAYIREHTEATTLEQYVATVKNHLEIDARNKKRSDIAAIILEKIVANAKKKTYNENEIQMYVDSAESNTKTEAESENISFEDYVTKRLGYESVDTYREYTRNTAKSYVDNLMVISALAYAENLNVTEEEYLNQLNTYKTVYGLSDQTLHSHYTSEDIIYSLLIVKVQDWILENSIKLSEPE